MPPKTRKTKKSARTRKTAKARTRRVAVNVRIQAPPASALRAATLPVGLNTATFSRAVSPSSSWVEPFSAAVRLCTSGVYQAANKTVLVDCDIGPCNCMPGLYESIEAFEHGDPPMDKFALKTASQLQAVWTRAKAAAAKKFGPGFELTVFICNGPPAIALRGPRLKPRLA